MPNYGYTPQYDDLEPLINYLPRKPTPSHAPAGNYLSPDLFAPIERKDDDEEESAVSYPTTNGNAEDQQHYYLVPVHAKTGSKPVLALLVKRRDG